jgi:hypothetical protein
MDQAPASFRDSGRVALPVLLAAVFLAVIGASAGVVAGRMSHASKLMTDGQGSGSGGAGSSTGAGKNPSTRASGSHAASTGADCPAESAAGAHDTLTLVMYVEADAVEAWICRAAGNGQLWYQGHRKTTPDSRYPQEAMVEGSNSLLLGGVVVLSSGRYEAVNTDSSGRVTRYDVSASQVVIARQDGTQTTYKVTRHVP